MERFPRAHVLLRVSNLFSQLSFQASSCFSRERERERERIFSYILFSEIDEVFEEKIYIIILIRDWRSRLDSK